MSKEGYENAVRKGALPHVMAYRPLLHVGAFIANRVRT